MDKCYLELSYYLAAAQKSFRNRIKDKKKVCLFGEEQKTGYSSSWVIEFKPGNDEKAFCKKILNAPEGYTLLYKLLHDASSRYSRNRRNTNIIYHNVSKSLVPKLLGEDEKEFVLLFEYLNEPTDRTKLIEIAKQKNSELKKNFLYDASKKIACFGGLVNAHQDQFPSSSLETPPKLELWSEIFLDNLFNIINYNQKPTEGKNIDEAKRSFLQNSLYKDLYETVCQIANLREAVHEIASSGESLEKKLRLGHGDCRVHHVIDNKFVDLELFGLNHWGQDLVTYFSAEGGIAHPTIEEFPRLLAYYLAYEKAYELPDPKARGAEVGRLDGIERTQMPVQTDVKTYANFMMSVLGRMIEENLHLDASNKRYGSEHLAHFVNGIPNYTFKDSETARLAHINELFELVAEQNTMINLCTTPSEIRNYFCSLGKLLRDVDLVKIPDSVLKKIGNGQYNG